MKQTFFSILLGCLLITGSFAQKVEFKEFDLDNGLHVIMHQDNSAPLVTVGVMYDVGGKDLGGDQANGNRTGFAHFFEHLLFEGTPNIERSSWFGLVSSNGGQNNANTSLDRTYYYEVFPSNNLELGLWLESERMFHPIIDQVGVDTQNEVVKEEKRLSYDNRPYGQLLFAISENLFENHPYKYKNIGEMADLDAATLEEFNAYFDKWYIPNNAVLVITGDIDKSNTEALVKKYFSGVPKGVKPTRNFLKEDPITTQKEVTYYDPNIQLPAVISAYRTPGFGTREAYILEMVSSYLSGGKSSVLYKKLIDEQQQALTVQAFNISQKDYGAYAIFGLPLGDTTSETLVAEIDEEILKLQTELISERDFQKLQNTFENNFVNSNSGMQGIAGSLATYYLLYDDVNLINKEIEIYRSITREEIRDAVKKYLSPNQRVLINYLPESTK